MLWAALAKSEVVVVLPEAYKLKLTKRHSLLVETVVPELSPRTFICRDGATLASFVLGFPAHSMSSATTSLKSTSHHLKRRCLMAESVPRGKDLETKFR